MQMCIEIIRLLFSPLRVALSKSCKSPEVSIINVCLGASPETVLRAPRKQRLCQTDRTGGWCFAGLSVDVKPVLANHFAVSPESCSIQEEKYSEFRSESQGWSRSLALCELHAIPSKGGLIYITGEVTVAGSQGCWRERRDIHLQNAANVIKGREVASTTRFLFASQNAGYMRMRKPLLTKSPPPQPV